MTMVPETTFNERIWTLLQEIRRQHLLVGDTNPLTLVFDHKLLGDTMKDHLDLLAQMRKLKIIRLAGDGTFDENNLQAIASIKINNPLFDRVYTLYENGNSRQTEPKKLFGMFNALVKGEYENLKPEVKKFIESKVLSGLGTGEIEYNPTTGKGCHGSMEFTLGDGSPEHRLFSKLYEKINTSMELPTVMQNIGLALLTIFIPVALFLFEKNDESNFKTLDKAVILDHLVDARNWPGPQKLHAKLVSLQA